jgi:P-type conjugative transfer protein TrbG
MKNLLGIIILSVVSATAAANPADEDMTEMYFSGKNPTLTAQEKASIAISEKFQATTAKTPPAIGPDGSILFVYGRQQPSIVCSVLQVCDVALQAGEQVNSLNLGDTVRWTVDPAITGSGPNEVQHLIIKPHDVGLDTSLVVTTDRRTYHLRLRSHRTMYMPLVAFVYQEESVSKWQAIKDREKKEIQEKTNPQTGEYMGNLNFNYEVTGDTSWKPTRVYNDGTKTIIEMPPSMSQTEAPTLLVVRKDGGLFTDDETVMVNYRIQSNRYIVDTVFEKAILIAGVGGSQDIVTIQREGE